MNFTNKLCNKVCHFIFLLTLSAKGVCLELSRQSNSSKLFSSLKLIPARLSLPPSQGLVFSFSGSAVAEHSFKAKLTSLKSKTSDAFGCLASFLSFTF